MKLRILRDFLGALAEAVLPETQQRREIREREALKRALRGEDGGQR
ncbi:hypothetical protein [Micromonospora sediminicola]